LLAISCLVLVTGISTAGFRPHKSHSRHASVAEHATSVHHAKATKVRDLEEEIPQPNVEQVQAEIETALSEMAELTKSFDKVKADLEQLKSGNPARDTASQSAESAPLSAEEETKPADEVQDSFQQEDADNSDLALLQFDDMNNGMDDDDTPALIPQMNRMRSTIMSQLSTDEPQAPASVSDGYVFGVKQTADGPRTYDVTADGEMIIRDVPATATPPPTKEDVVPKPHALAINATEDNDVVCVCKRHQHAPRGFDRIRCKRHTPSPSPSPSAAARVVEGIRQCANGTWQSGADAGTKDVICIYFPAIVPAPPAPPPAPVNDEPEYPPECYDERNEWIADEVVPGVVERRKYDVLLLQQGYETCGC